MKRPQSAKMGYRQGQVQHSYEDFREDEPPHKNHNRNKVKIMKPDLTSNDFARVMPKKIYQDKERLYSQGLQLKQALNELTDENVRLKTRISILEKEKDKMGKYIDTAAENSNKAHSRLNMYTAPKGNEKENMMVRNLKKMVRDSREENKYLKQENAKIKKAIKYTKINELEIERKMLLDENQRINQILVELNGELADQEDYEQELSELKGYLEEEVQANEELTKSNQKYLEYIEQLEDKLKKETERAQEKEKKLQRELALQKRKVAESVKVSDDLRKQIRLLKETPQNDFKKKPKPGTRPASSHPYSTQNRGELGFGQTIQKKQIEQIKHHNEELEKQLIDVKLKLQKSEQALKEKIQPRKQESDKKISDKKIKKEELPNESLKLDSEPKDDDDDLEDSDKIHQPFILKQESKVGNVGEEDYEQEFDDEDKEKDKEKDEQLESYKKDFEEESGDAEQIFKKETDKDSSNKKGRTDKHSKEKKKKAGTGKYKPNKKELTEIKQLLTYRMKAHRYPFSELEKDIEQSKETEFTRLQLEAMLKSEPFFLKPSYVATFVHYAFESQDPPSDGIITNSTFLKKMRKMIDDFELLNEKEEEEMLLRIAEMTTTYPGELEASFEQVKNGPDTISKQKLIEMFKRLELADHYIESIITELSLCSEDLEHLNFHGFFERFYIEDGMEEPGAIDQEQIESSGEEPKQTKIHKIDEEQEYEDDKVNFILDDEGELSMGMRQGGKDYNDDIVSDDGHI